MTNGDQRNKFLMIIGIAAGVILIGALLYVIDETDDNETETGAVEFVSHQMSIKTDQEGNEFFEVIGEIINNNMFDIENVVISTRFVEGKLFKLFLGES